MDKGRRNWSESRRFTAGDPYNVASLAIPRKDLTEILVEIFEFEKGMVGFLPWPPIS